MKTLSLIILATISTSIVFVADRKADLFAAFKPIEVSEKIPVFVTIAVYEPAPVYEPVPSFNPIPPSEKIPVEAFITTDGTETAPSWAFQWRNLIEDENLWKILTSLIPSLISIMSCLMLYCHRRGRDREEYTMKAVMKVEDELRAQFQNEMKEEAELRAQFQNEMEEDELRAQFQKKMKMFCELHGEFNVIVGLTLSGLRSRSRDRPLCA
jgi:hypothetical protein